jgi:hypothetical protein
VKQPDVKAQKTPIANAIGTPGNTASRNAATIECHRISK